MASPITRAASTGSMPCQKKWLGSKLQPSCLPQSFRSFSSVSGLYTQKPGWASKAIFTPSLAAALFFFVQNGISTSFHW